MTPQAQVHASLSRLAQRSPLWRAAIPLVSVQVTRRIRTAGTVGAEIRINPQYTATLTDAEIDAVLAAQLGGVYTIQDILAREMRV